MFHREWVESTIRSDEVDISRHTNPMAQLPFRVRIRQESIEKINPPKTMCKVTGLEGCDGQNVPLDGVSFVETLIGKLREDQMQLAEGVRRHEVVQNLGQLVLTAPKVLRRVGTDIGVPVTHAEVHEGVRKDVNLVMQTHAHPHVEVVQSAHERVVEAERVVHRTSNQNRGMTEAVAIEKE